MKIPKMKEVFFEEKNIETPAFKSWFKNSKVIDKNGEPLVVYHGTTHPFDIRSFMVFNDIGHHFGTADSADDRLRAKSIEQDPDNEYLETSKVYPVYLSIQNPLYIPDDLGTWEPEDVLRPDRNQKYVSHGVNFTDDEYNSVAMKLNKKERTIELLRILKKHGYDGVKYKNVIEDPGSISWIAFEPQQIKSIYNKGTWSPSKTNIQES
jgi:hypothetical protein